MLFLIFFCARIMKNNYIWKEKNVNQFTEDGIINAINDINKQISYIKSIYNVKNAGIQQNIQLNNIQNSIQNIVESIEPVENKKIEIFFDSKVDLTRILDILNVKVD